MWGTKGTVKKYFLIHSTQIGSGAHTVCYSIGVGGCRNYKVLIDLPNYIKQKYTFKKKSNKSFERMKIQREKQDKISTLLLHCTSFL